MILLGDRVYEGKDVTSRDCLIRKAPIEEAWPKKRRLRKPMYLVRRAMISKAMNDPSQR